MSLKDRFHRFTFSKGFVFVLSALFGLGSGFGSTLFSDKTWVWLVSGTIGFLLIWALYAFLIFFLLTDNTAKGEEL